jgi:hypothetical protein
MAKPDDKESEDGIETVEAEEVDSADGADADAIAAEEIPGDEREQGTDDPAAAAPGSRFGSNAWIMVIAAAVIVAGAIVGILLMQSGTGTSALDAQTAARITALEADRDGLQKRLQAMQAENDALKDKQARLEQALAAVNNASTGHGDRISGLEAAVARQADALAAAARPQTPGVDPAELTTLRDAIVRLEAQTAAQQERERITAGRLDAGDERLAALEGATTSNNAVVLAVGQLHADVTEGRSFVESLKIARTLIGEADEEVMSAISALQASAPKGVATRHQLQARFGTTLAAVLASQHSDAEGFWARTVNRVKGLVSIRRTGEVAGDDIEAVMARAEVRANAGNLAGAAEQMSALSGPGANAAADWLEAVQARLEAEKAVARLRMFAISTLAKS